MGKLKTNVVKKPYKVLVEGVDTDLTKWTSWTEVYAESEDAAALQIPEEYKVLEIKEVEEEDE